MGFSLTELILVITLAHPVFCPVPTTSANRLPQPTLLPFSGCTAFTVLMVLFGCPTTHMASLSTSLFAYRIPYPGAIRKPCEFSWGHALFFHTVPSANTLVQWVNENAFASIVQARPCPTFGRPVRLRMAPSTTARYFSAYPSDSISRWTPCPPVVF